MQFILLLLLAGPASAETTTQPCWHAQKIQSQAALSGAKEVSIQGDGKTCVIRWTPKAGATPFVYTDVRALQLESKELEAKLDSNVPLTTGEQKRLFKLLLQLLRVIGDQSGRQWEP